MKITLPQCYKQFVVKQDFKMILAFTLNTTKFSLSINKKEAYEKFRSLSLDGPLEMAWWELLKHQVLFSKELETALFKRFGGVIANTALASSKHLARFCELFTVLEKMCQDKSALPKGLAVERPKVIRAHCAEMLVGVLVSGDLVQTLHTLKMMRDSNLATAKALITILGSLEFFNYFYKKLVGKKDLSEYSLDKLVARAGHTHWEGSVLLIYSTDPQVMRCGKINAVLMLLVLASKDDKAFAPLKEFAYALLRQVLKNQTLNETQAYLIQLNPLENVAPLLPKQDKKEFCAYFSPQSLVLQEAEVESLAQSDKKPAKTTNVKKTKSLKTKQEPTAVLVETVPEVIHPPVVAEKVIPSALQPERDTSVPKPAAVAVAPEPVTLTAYQKWSNGLYRHSLELNQLIGHLEHEATVQLLPPGFLQVIALAKSELTKLFPERAAITQKYDVIDLSKPSCLESQWNQALSILCWNWECDIKKMVEVAFDKEEQRAFDAMRDALSDGILVLSGCYFKDLNPYFAPPFKAWLDLIKDSAVNFRVSIYGSQKVAPDYARDTDILLIPEIEFDSVTFKDAVESLVKLLDKGLSEQGVSAFSKKNNSPDGTLQYTFKVKYGAETQSVDLNFLQIGLSRPQELARLLKSHLSSSAVHWYLDGHALVTPKAARANYAKVLGISVMHELLPDTPPYFDFLRENGGFLLKNIIKFSKIPVRYDNLLQHFMTNYINPRTRYCSTNENPALRQLNQQIVREALKYLLDRIQQRFDETVSFILEKKLLHVVYPLDESTHALCAENFKTHFIPKQGLAELDKVTGPQFIIFYFLGGLLAKSDDIKAQFLDQLSTISEGCGVETNSLVAILQQAPRSVSEYESRVSDFQKSLTRRSMENHCLASIYRFWYVASEKERSGVILIPPPIKEVSESDVLDGAPITDRLRQIGMFKPPSEIRHKDAATSYSPPPSRPFAGSADSN